MGNLVLIFLNHRYEKNMFMNFLLYKIGWEKLSYKKKIECSEL